MVALASIVPTDDLDHRRVLDVEPRPACRECARRDLRRGVEHEHADVDRLLRVWGTRSPA